MDLNERKRLLKEYMALPRVSGYEGPAARRLREDLGRWAAASVIDRVGNVIATFPGTDPKAPSVMVFAHMDTIGYIITYIDPDGFLKVDRMGGVPEKAVASSAVLVGAENGTWVDGIIATKSYHVQTPEEKSKADSLAKMFIDIGAASRQQVLDLGIQVGCPVSYRPIAFDLLNDRICGSYLDDASGMVTMVEVAQQLAAVPHKGTVYLVGTVWEEFNARGAMMAARSVHPDMAVCLLGPGAGDTPDLKGTTNVVMEGGPAVTLFNVHGKGTLNGCVAHKGMYELMKRAAADSGLSLQRSAGRGALSDTAYLQLEDMGVPCLDMGCPDRYSHSPYECLSLADHANTGKLLYRFLTYVDDTFVLDRY